MDIGDSHLLLTPGVMVCRTRKRDKKTCHPLAPVLSCAKTPLANLFSKRPPETADVAGFARDTRPGLRSFGYRAPFGHAPVTHQDQGRRDGPRGTLPGPWLFRAPENRRYSIVSNRLTVTSNTATVMPPFLVYRRKQTGDCLQYRANIAAQMADEGVGPTCFPSASIP